MLVLFIRVQIIYFVVLLFLRIMGKRQIGEMQPYELVITLIIADLATVPMSDANIPLLNGILPLAILVILHFSITMLTRKSVFLRKLISGQPVIVISPDGINYDALKKLNMNLHDLQESLRQCNYFNFEQVQYAIIETNGKMSVIPTSQDAPATAQDVKANNPQPELPTLIVSDGKMMKENMQLLNMSEEKLNTLLQQLQIKKLKDIIVMNLNNSGKMYYQLKNKSYKVVENINNLNIQSNKKSSSKQI
ncbi:MAG: DUF421 domain-containing protein [Clostridia bacterium]|nr:DUF421 domain-containing protein [Clostridia bacterium]